MRDREEFGSSLTFDGAKRLATKIRDYWRERGNEVAVEVAPVTFTDRGRLVRMEAHYGVRSNLLNGSPSGGPIFKTEPELGPWVPKKRRRAEVEAEAEAEEHLEVMIG